MLLPALAVITGLALLVWSADAFVDGAAATAHHHKVPPLLVGMVIVGFGTSAPELVVSTLAALDGTPYLALGNAWGSNIVNITLIVGVTAWIVPMKVDSKVLRKEMPLLIVMTALAAGLAIDGQLTRWDSSILLLVFLTMFGWSIVEGRRNRGDTWGKETAAGIQDIKLTKGQALNKLAMGLLVLIGSSRMLVWGAVEGARALGISELIIGLTILALGTSLPELASCIAAAKKGQDDIALGNVLGSNMLNTLAAVGLAGAISPFSLEAEAIERDLPVMVVLTVTLFIMSLGWRGRQGRINRYEAAALLLAYLAYTGWVLSSLRGHTLPT
ncbi:calcium/sodium antiporter [Hydrogenophaga sp. 5NK40-0174]|uniref:calcium/sodium antiporter n=1 Tax=Hydrogenophaga sp. 5NK40-0174 TaxID=3127649 RepID=UPI00310A4BB0